MSSRFATLGNDLYTGQRSVPVVQKSRVAYIGSAVVLAVAVFGLVFQGLNLGLEFRGGSEFRVATTSLPATYEDVAREALGASEADRDVNITLVGNDTVRVQTDRLNETDSQAVRADLADAFGVATSEVSSTFIGPSWGASVSQQALRALVIFLVLVAIVMSIYFRNWKMAAAALIALAHDMVITVGIYALVGFEVSPATMIGFLTVLGYSLYDTVVVFDKVRENTNEAFANGRVTFVQAANLAVNQTIVRSINTTVIGLLPITAVLAVGAVWLGPGVLLDLSLVLFVGILVGAYSSIFIATPLLVTLRRNDAAVLELDKRAARHQARKAKDLEAAEAAEVQAAERAGDDIDDTLVGVGSGASGGPAAASGDSSTLSGRAVHKYAQTGPRNQPRRPPKSKR